ncbi:MAG: hypothetical protein KAU58_04280 [Candidatus Omnitrophica bacterium]|nr:hypothetical protein [Candidatus Omnitrophota bacterium]
MDISESEDRIREYSAVIRGKSAEVASELMTEQGLVFKLADTEEEAKFICQNQVSRYYQDEKYEIGSACLIQIERFQHIRDISGYVKGLCQLGDHYYYDKGDCAKALICFQLAAGIDVESGEALHGAVIVLGQGLCRYAEALPYAVVADHVNPGRNAESYVRGKLKDI